MKRALLGVALVASFIATPLFAERILLPVYTPPIHGAFGSEFRTDLRILNIGEETIGIDGLLPYCTVCLSPPLSYRLDPGHEFAPGEIDPNGTPGRFLRVADNTLDDLAMNLRVYDVTRDAKNFGTEIPIVRESDFLINRVVLTGVPTDARFRNTLRIYSIAKVPMLVKVGNAAPVSVELSAGESIFEPAYGIFSSFPTGTAPIRVEVIANPDFVSLLPIEIPIWAFITVTNNDTQAITTISPQ